MKRRLSARAYCRVCQTTWLRKHGLSCAIRAPTSSRIFDRTSGDSMMVAQRRQPPCRRCSTAARLLSSQNRASDRPSFIPALLSLLLFLKFPALRFFHFIDLSLDIFEDLVLEGAKLAVPLEHVLITAQQHVEPEELPFGEAFGFLDIGKRVAPEGFSPVRSFLTKLALIALDHILSFTCTFRLC